MDINDTNKLKLLYPKLSYKITGLCFTVHNDLGRYSREVQYADALEKELKANKVPYKREYTVRDTRNRVDFIIDDKVLLELKAKDIIGREEYFQVQRYLQVTQLRLGLLLNFRQKYLRPKRIVLINTDNRTKFLPH